MDRAAARHALNIDPQDFVVTFTGRISHIKGVDVLLSSIRLLADKIPNLKVFIIGSLVWGMVFDGFHPDRYDITGAALCVRAGVGSPPFGPATGSVAA